MAPSPNDTPLTERCALDVAGAGVALREHPLVTLTWVAAALAIAMGIGPWVSKVSGLFLPAFAMVRLGRPTNRH